MYDLQIYNFWTLKVVDSTTQNNPNLLRKLNFFLPSYFGITRRNIKKLGVGVWLTLGWGNMIFNVGWRMAGWVAGFDRI